MRINNKVVCSSFAFAKTEKRLEAGIQVTMVSFKKKKKKLPWLNGNK